MSHPIFILFYWKEITLKTNEKKKRVKNREDSGGVVSAYQAFMSDSV